MRLDKKITICYAELSLKQRVIVMTLGQRLEKKRIEAGLSQLELAEKINTSPTMISLYESDSRNPSFKKLELISYYLKTTVDYLMNGALEAGNDPISKKISLAMRYLDVKQRNKIFEYICQITGTGIFNFDLPFCSTPVECARALIKKLEMQLPIDVYSIAEQIGIEVIKVDKHEEDQGYLIKAGVKPIVILDESVANKERIKFTLAMLIGNFIMPWHLKGSFSRKHGEKSSEVIDPMQIESRKFAEELIMPMMHIEKEFKEFKEMPSYDTFCKLAYERYEVSATTFIKRYLSYFKREDIVFICSSEGCVSRIEEVGFPYEVSKDVNQKTFAGQLMHNMPNEKVILNGYIDASLWLIDAPEGLKVFEESYIDPQYGYAMTLLKI